MQWEDENPDQQNMVKSCIHINPLTVGLFSFLSLGDEIVIDPPCVLLLIHGQLLDSGHSFLDQVEFKYVANL